MYLCASNIVVGAIKKSLAFLEYCEISRIFVDSFNTELSHLRVGVDAAALGAVEEGHGPGAPQVDRQLGGHVGLLPGLLHRGLKHAVTLRDAPAHETVCKIKCRVPQCDNFDMDAEYTKFRKKHLLSFAAFTLRNLRIYYYEDTFLNRFRNCLFNQTWVACCLPSDILIDLLF